MTSNISPINNTWVRLQDGRKGDLVGFHNRVLVLFRDTAGAKAGDFVRVSAKPSKKGTCLIAEVDFCTAAQVAAVAKVPEGVDPQGPKAKDEAIRAFVRAELAAQAAQAELAERRAREAAEAAEKARLATEARAVAQAKVEKSAGKRGAAFLEALERFDPYFAFSDDARVAREGQEVKKQLEAAWAKLTERQQLHVLADGRLDGKLRALQLG